MAKDSAISNRSLFSRRQVLESAAAAALVSVLHPAELLAAAPRSLAAGSATEPRISGLRLYTAAPFSNLKDFYHGSLGFPVVSEGAVEITFQGGLTPITFVVAPPEMGNPWYHVAFNIPENKLLLAREWQLRRSPLIPTPPRAVDPRYPGDIRHFPRWNSHAMFFWDPAGNLLEYIARHDLNNGSDGAFTVADILYVSEIGLVVDEQAATARQLHEDLGLEVYPRATRNWWAMGDETGLLLCIPKRLWGENTERPKRFAVFPTEATIRGASEGAQRLYQVPGYPYRVTVV